jgi:isopenicillin N synthase-like dioxygenase
MTRTENSSMTRMPPTAATPAAVMPLTVPTIAFGRFRDGDAATRHAIAAQIIAAAETYGFFYLSDNGVPRAQIDAAFDAARAFFALPLADRMACRAGEKRQNRGYQPMFDTQQRAEATPDGKESFDMGFPFPADDPGVMAGLPFHGRNTWPDMPGFRDTIEGLYTRLLTTGHDVLRAMALGLGADPELFAGQCQRPSTNMRLVHYPPQDQIAGRTDKGAGAHTDRGLITLLLNDNEAGLEVQSRGRHVDRRAAQGRCPDRQRRPIDDALDQWEAAVSRASRHQCVGARAVFDPAVPPPRLPHGGGSPRPAIDG